MKLLPVTLLLGITSALCQPFQIGHITFDYIDPYRGNRFVNTEIYYPADIAGEDVPVTSQTSQPFPLIVFGHGFMMPWNAYENIWSALVPEGYIMAFATTEGSLAPSHEDFGKDLAFLIKTISAEAGIQSTLFYQRISSMNCVMGHSMGGGAAYLAAAEDQAITAIATLTPAETNPSAKAAAGSVAIPALMFAGGNDCVTPPSSHQIPIFYSLASPCSFLISIIGGSHCQMAEYNLYCSLGELTCIPSPAITRAKQHEVINRYLMPWLAFQLKNDTSAGVHFDSILKTDSEINYHKNCNLVSVKENQVNDIYPVRIFPNPAGECLHVTCQSDMKVVVKFYDLSMREVFKTEVEGETLIHLSDLAAGLYLYTLNMKGKTIMQGKLIKN